MKGSFFAEMVGENRSIFVRGVKFFFFHAVENRVSGGNADLSSSNGQYIRHVKKFF